MRERRRPPAARAFAGRMAASTTDLPGVSQPAPLRQHEQTAARERGGLRMLTKSTDWQSDEKARKQGNFASGKICRRRRLDLTIPKGSANPPKEAVLASKGAYIDVSDRRMQVQLTRKLCLRQNFRPLTNPSQRSIFLKNPKKPKGKGSPHVEYKHINTTRKKIRR